MPAIVALAAIYMSMVFRIVGPDSSHLGLSWASSHLGLVWVVDECIRILQIRFADWIRILLQLLVVGLIFLVGIILFSSRFMSLLVVIGSGRSLVKFPFFLFSDLLKLITTGTIAGFFITFTYVGGQRTLLCLEVLAMFLEGRICFRLVDGCK